MNKLFSFLLLMFSRILHLVPYLFLILIDSKLIPYAFNRYDLY